MFFDAPGLNIVQKIHLSDVEAAVTVGGFILAILKHFFEFSRSTPNLLSKRNKELDQAGQLAGFYAQIAQTALPPAQLQALRDGIQARLQDCVLAIERLNLKLAENDKDPNTKLSTWKRLFLWFKPPGWREIIPHILAYVCFASALWAAYKAATNWDGSGYGFLLVTGMAMALTFMFHSWSLDERRRKLGYRKKLGKITQFFLVQPPENLKMFAGQIFFFINAIIGTGILIALISAPPEDVGTVFGVLVLVSVLFLIASIFHGWAAAEFKYEEIKYSNPSAKLLPLRASLKYVFRNVRRHGWVMTKLILVYLLSLGLGFAIIGILVDGEGTWGIVVLILTIGVLVYPSNRVVKIYFSIEQATASAVAPEELAVAAGSASN